jgi:hypothetical protein
VKEADADAAAMTATSRDDGCIRRGGSALLS